MSEAISRPRSMVEEKTERKNASSLVFLLHTIFHASRKKETDRSIASFARKGEEYTPRREDDRCWDINAPVANLSWRREEGTLVQRRIPRGCESVTAYRARGHRCIVIFPHAMRTEKYEREREREASVTFLLRSPPRSSKGKLGGVDNLVPFANSRSHARTTRWWDGNFVGHPHFPSDRPNRECPINVFESRAICSERVSSLWGESLQLETHNFFITRRRKTEDRFYSTRRVMWLSRNEG